MQNVTIRYIGGLKEPYFREIAAEYEKRLSGYCRLVNAAAKDDAAIRAALTKRSYKIALCVEGNMLTSEEFAGMLERASFNYPSVDFIIGGANGLEADTKAMCDFKLSMSKMTFPHRMARLLLLEQIYRAYTIIKNGKYHK